MISFIVSKQRFRKWSIPNKITYISGLITIISLIVTLSYKGFIVVRNNHLTSVVFELKKSDESNNWIKVERLLKKIKGKKGYDDAYNYYYARYLETSNHIKSYSKIEDCDYFLKKIQPSSEYFEPAIKYRVFIYLKRKNLAKLKGLKEELESISYTAPVYFFIRFNLIENKSEIWKEYSEFIKNYPYAANLKNCNFEFYVNQNPVYLFRPYELYALIFLYKSQMFNFPTKENKISRVQAAKDIIAMTSCSKEEDFINILWAGYNFLGFGLIKYEYFKSKLLYYKKYVNDCLNNE